MPRPPRLEFPGALYHVTARGNERRAIFRDDHDRRHYLDRLASYRARFDFRLLAFCLMTNHLHLAIRTGSVRLSRIMACLHSTYAEWFNRRHERVGHLFQGRDNASLVQEDRYLLALLRYIHLNPVVAHIVAKPADYRWSSDRMLRRGRAPDWFDLDHVHSLIAPTRRAAIRRYVGLVDSGGSASAGKIPVIGGAVAGDRAFAIDRFEAAAEPTWSIKGVTPDKLLDAVSDETGISLSELASRSRGGDVAFARCLAAYAGSRFGGLSVRCIARRLGRNDSSFVRPVARLERRLDHDGALRDCVARIAARLRIDATASPVPAGLKLPHRGRSL
jgi:putative transposase